MKFKYFNDTNRIVSIHPATFIHGCSGDNEPINPLEERTFILPDGTYPWVKMWDYGEEIGLSILVSPMVEEKEENLSLHSQKYNVENGLWDEMLNSISLRVSSAAFGTWFKETNGEMVDGSLVVTCVNLFQRDWLDETYREMILDIAREVIGEKVELVLISEDKK